jgi:autotransporter adhesin
VAIHNVADGVADHDAVNVAQLNDRLTRSNTEVVTQANRYTDQRIDDVWGGVNKVANELVRQDRRISQVGAMSMAEAQMTSNAAAASVGNPNGAWAVGLGSQEGHGAISAGYAKPIGQKSRISFGAAFSGHDQSIGIGFGRAL